MEPRRWRTWSPLDSNRRLRVFFVIQRLLECRGELIEDWLRRPLGSEQGMPGKHLEVRKSGSLEVGTFGKAGLRSFAPMAQALVVPACSCGIEVSRSAHLRYS